MQLSFPTDFSCSRYTASGDVQLVGGETITVIADTLQSITCINNTVEIEHIGYDFIPTNAVVRKKEDYVSPHKHELKVFLNHSTTLIVRGLNSITANDADYTLEIKVNVEGMCA